MTLGAVKGTGPWALAMVGLDSSASTVSAAVAAIGTTRMKADTNKAMRLRMRLGFIRLPWSTAGFPLASDEADRCVARCASCDCLEARLLARFRSDQHHRHDYFCHQACASCSPLRALLADGGGKRRSKLASGAKRAMGPGKPAIVL